VKILDTDVCIEILRGNSRVIEQRRRTPDEVATTWITACELAYGAAKSRVTLGFASKLAPTGQFFGVKLVLIPSKLTSVNGYCWIPL